MLHTVLYCWRCTVQVGDRDPRLGHDDYDYVVFALACLPGATGALQPLPCHPGQFCVNPLLCNFSPLATQVKL